MLLLDDVLFSVSSFTPYGDDEPKTLPYAITLNCPTGADAGHQRGWLDLKHFYKPCSFVTPSVTPEHLGHQTIFTKYLKRMVPRGGFEPPTRGFSVRK
jgi:hypothetical protein